MDRTIAAQLTALNQIYKEIDELYHHYAKASGLSDTALWVLYSLWECGGPYPQREFCEEWNYSPQTANSALKSLEKQGLVALDFARGNRKSKEIRFTPEGEALARRVIVPLMEAERSAIAGLGEEERAALLAVTQKHAALLKEETEKLLLPEDG